MIRTIEKNSTYRCHRYYAITISPRRYDGSQGFIYESHKTDIRKWLNKFSQHWLLYPEFDMSTRLHYHGVVQVTDLTKFHKTRHSFSRLVGFVCIKPLTNAIDHISWLQYCKKDYGEQFLELYYYKKLKRGRSKCRPSPELDEGILKWCRPTTTSDE